MGWRRHYHLFLLAARSSLLWTRGHGAQGVCVPLSLPPSLLPSLPHVCVCACLCVLALFLFTRRTTKRRAGDDIIIFSSLLLGVALCRLEDMARKVRLLFPRSRPPSIFGSLPMPSLEDAHKDAHNIGFVARRIPIPRFLTTILPLHTASPSLPPSLPPFPQVQNPFGWDAEDHDLESFGICLNLGKRARKGGKEGGMGTKSGGRLHAISEARGTRNRLFSIRGVCSCSSLHIFPRVSQTPILALTHPSLPPSLPASPASLPPSFRRPRDREDVRCP
jgi:hypothetical protein